MKEYAGKNRVLSYGYRIATAEERILLNERGRCWLIRDWGDKAMSCPGDQWRDGYCELHHSELFK